MHLIKYKKTQFMISTNPYMFRHISAIFREWNEVTYWTCDPSRSYNSLKIAPRCRKMYLPCSASYDLYFTVIYLRVFVGQCAEFSKQV